MPGRRWLYAGLILCVLLATRLPFAARQIYSFDDVNLTYAVDDFDIRLGQPQPPGYPLFVVQQKLFRLIGFKNPVSNLTALAMFGSFAALLAARWAGRSIFGGSAGSYALWLLLFHPTFWYTTLTSGLRVQLALISAAVAGACWRAWNGEVRWVYLSAIALGLGAGIRQELGPLLFPLWLVSVWRSGASAKTRWISLGVLTATVLSWLVPLMWLSGGPAAFMRVCLTYLGAQDTMQTEFLDMSWRRTAVWFAVWTFSGWLLWPLFAWLGRGGSGLSKSQIAFFALWMLPGVAFALLVHVADPGHTLALLVPATLLLAHQVSRAVERQRQAQASRWDALYPVLLAGPLIAIPFVKPGEAHYAVFAACLMFAILAPRMAGTRLSRAATAGFLLAPSLAHSAYLFATPGWFSANPGYFSWAEIRSHMNSGIAVSTLEHYQLVVNIDDANIRTIWSMTEARKGPAVMLWERGLTETRKLAYYGRVPLIVLERGTDQRAPLFTKFDGPRALARVQSQAPLRVPLEPGSRLLWIVLPKSPFAAELRRAFPGQQIDDVYVADLPEEPGERRVEDFLFTW